MMYVITICILLTVIVVLAFQTFKWYVSVMALLNWIERKGLTPPALEDLNRSVGIVIRNIIKKIFKRR